MIELGQNREWVGAQFSLKFFMTRYLHDPKTGKLLSWLPHYEDWYRIVRDEKRSNVESPRGHGKSIFWSYALPMWDVIRGGADFLLVSYSEGQVVELLRMIRVEIESNDFLTPIRPSTREIWMADKLGFSDGGIIRGLGFGTSARGLHPKRIVGDDMLKDSGGISPEEQERFWFGVVAGMAMPETKVHAIGTPVDFDDLLTKLEAVDTGHVPEQGTWESARGYFNWKIPADNGNFVPMCPQLFTEEALRSKYREQGSLIYEREYRLKRIDPATQPFKRDYETLYDVAPDRERFMHVVTVADPAYTENDGDATGIITMGITHGNHGYVLMKSNIRREDPGMIVDEIYKHIRAYTPDAVGIKRRKGDAISFSFNERMTRENLWNFRYVELKDSGHKKDRVGGMVPRWEARAIHIHKEMKDLLKQLYEYRLDDSHSNDDMVDAMADCFSPELVVPNAGKRYVPRPETSRVGRPFYGIGSTAVAGNGTQVDDVLRSWKVGNKIEQVA